MDGVTYGGLLSLTRVSELVEGQNSGEAKDGTQIYDIPGTRCRYTLQLDADGMGADAYDAFYEAVTAPQAGHTFTLPYGQGERSFQGHVALVQDALERYDGQSPVWGSLQLEVYPVSPQRRPS